MWNFCYPWTRSVVIVHNLRNDFAISYFLSIIYSRRYQEVNYKHSSFRYVQKYSSADKGSASVISCLLWSIKSDTGMDQVIEAC